MKFITKRGLIVGFSIILLILLYAFKNVSFLLRALSAFSGIFLFYVYDEYFKMNFHMRHYFYVLVFVTFGILLSPLYFLSESYDKILHLTMQILLSAIVFYIINKQPLRLRWKLLFTLLSVIAILAIFEIIEYSMDLLWDFKVQGVYLRDSTGLEKLNLVMDKNDDTMIDLIFGTTGSLIFIAGKSIAQLTKRFKK